MASAPIYWPDSLPLPLMHPSREYRPRAEIHQMESKRIRVRRYYPDFFTVYDFEWNFTQDEFDAFKTFFEEDLDNGAEAFRIQMLDPLDSGQLSIIDYGFFEAGYQFSYSDGVFKVTAVVVIEAEQLDPFPEPFPAGLCEVVINPEVSDGLGGGNPFECYALGNYGDTTFTVAGTYITGIFHGDGEFGFQGGEDYETFPTGALFLGSPSTGSHLVLMYFGDADFGFVGYGSDFEDDDLGTYVPSEQVEEETGLIQTYSGDGP